MEVIYLAACSQLYLVVMLLFFHFNFFLLLTSQSAESKLVLPSCVVTHGVKTKLGNAFSDGSSSNVTGRSFRFATEISTSTSSQVWRQVFPQHHRPLKQLQSHKQAAHKHTVYCPLLLAVPKPSGPSFPLTCKIIYTGLLFLHICWMYFSFVAI